MVARRAESSEDPDEGGVGVLYLTPEEGRAYFDEASRSLLGISGEEFLRRFDAGEYRELPDIPENSDIGHLAIMIPFARQEP